MLEEGVRNHYDMDELVTFRVFTMFDGTIFKSQMLWTQTIGLGVLYFIVYFFVLWNRFKNFGEFMGSAGSIRAFLAMFSTLIGLLLSFYTALNLGRWWSMRTGVHQIQEGCKRLILMVSPLTGDDKVIDAISRYARASLYMIFQASQQQANPPQRAVEAGLLTDEEASKLKECSPHLVFVQAEALWAWIGHAITRLHDKGLTKGPPHYCALMAAVELGRSGIATIQSYLETPIPLGYVHLLCWMVKLHNIIVTLLMALECVRYSGGANGFRIVSVFRVTFRAFFMPFLYNAILVLNAEVIDPFGNDKSDFNFSNFDLNMLASQSSYRKAKGNMPACLIASDEKK